SPVARFGGPVALVTGRGEGRAYGSCHAGCRGHQITVRRQDIYVKCIILIIAMQITYTAWVQIEDLRRLLALAEYGQVTDAAAVLRISQPTLSRLLARAENELGTRLFERDGGGVRPNPYGEMTLAAARDITRRYDQLRGDLAELLDPDPGTVRLAFLDSIATSLVPRILHDFRQEAPRVRVALRQEPGHEILQDLASGLSELALTSPRPPGPHGWLPLQ